MPDYNLTLSIDSSPAFVHVFNPKFEELLAIELTSGISNSFNHDKGLDEIIKKRKFKRSKLGTLLRIGHYINIMFKAISIFLHHYVCEQDEWQD